MFDEVIAVTTLINRFQERVQRLEAEIAVLRSDLKQLTALAQPVAVYEFEGEQIIITEADVVAVQAQLARSHPQEVIQELALINKIEAIRAMALARSGVKVTPTNLFRWSYTWGVLIFLYSVICLIVFLAGFAWVDALSSIRVGLATETVRAAWFSALAGGIGGVIAVFYVLQYMTLRSGFNRRNLNVVDYLVQPVIGFILGIGVYIVVSVILFLFNAGVLVNSDQVIATQVLLAWVIGFRQHAILMIIDDGVQWLLSRMKVGKEKTG